MKKLLLLIFILFAGLVHAQNFKWAFRAGGTDIDEGKGIAVDTNGNIYCIGYFIGTATFDSLGIARSVTSAGGIDIVLAKFNCSRVLQWAVTCGSTSDDWRIYQQAGIALDASANIYITGSFTGNCTFNTKSGSAISLTSSGDHDAFIGKYNTNGVVQWVNKGGSTNRDEGFGIYSDAAGTVYATGQFSDGASFSTTSGSALSLTSAGDVDAYLVKYNSAGVIQWAQKGGGTGEDLGSRIDADKAGNVFVAGNFFNVGTFGSQSVTSAGSWDAFIAKCNSSGTWQWVNRAGTGTGPDVGAGVGVDSSDNVYMTGGFSGTATFSTTSGSALSLTSSGLYDIYISKYNNNGIIQWAVKAGGTGDDNGQVLIVSDSGHIYLLGNFSNTATFGIGSTTLSLTSNGGRDMAFARYDLDGMIQWALKAGGTGDDVAGDIITDRDGDYYITGGFRNTISFGSHSLTSTGQSDIVIAKSGLPLDVNVFTDISTFCPGDSAMLYADSIPQFSYRWKRNGVIISGANSLRYTAKTAGTYRVLASSPCNETDSDEIVITTIAAATALFNYKDTCIYSGVTFTDQSTASSGSISSWTWDFGDGDTSTTPSPFHIYSATGIYSVKLITTHPTGCNDSIVKTISIMAQPTAAFSGYDVCQDSGILFTNTSSLGTDTLRSSWSFGDGDTSTLNSPLKYYTTDGTFQVKLVVSSKAGCKDSVTNSVTIFPVPLADFTLANHCADSGITFGNVSTIASGTFSNVWAFGDGITSNAVSPFHQYGISGSYNVSLTTFSDKGCKDSIMKVITVHPLPLADFAAVNACRDTIVTFTDQSTISTGSISSWEWDFGDSTTSVAQNPTHQYVYAGNHDVLLIVTSVNGCRDSITKTVVSNSATVLYPLPIAQFSYNSHCRDTAVTFQDLSVVLSGSITGWSWDFGDNSFSSTASPSHLYALSGPKQVKLIVTTDHGCKDSITNTVDVYTDPVASFTFISSCQDSALAFSDNSTISTGTLAGRSWDFGDTTGSVLQAPFHAYGSPGNYFVSLIAISDMGCRDTQTQIVTAYPLPFAEFTFISRCQDSALSFTDLSMPGLSTITGWLWQFDDSIYSSLQHPNHSYLFPGNKNVWLTAITDRGCRDSMQHTVNVFDLPLTDFSFGIACEDSAISFYDLTSVNSGVVSSWQWDFGDGGTSGAQNPSYLFTNTGSHIVSLITSSDHGCKDTLVKSISLNPVPLADFTAIDACRGKDIFFTDNSTIVSGAVISWSWDFSDLSGSPLQDPSHIFATHGTKQVKLTVTSDLGCVSSITKGVFVFPIPDAIFYVTDVCVGKPTPFLDNSYIPTGNIAEWHWDFGNGDSDNVQSPIYLYPMPGTYNVRLIAVSDNGCRDTVNKPLKVFANPVVGFTTDINDGCVPLQVQFFDTSSVTDGFISSWEWRMGDGNYSTVANPLHTYRVAGLFSITYTVRSSVGCVTTINVPDLINVYPLPDADFYALPDSVSYLNPEVEFFDLTTGAINWYWDFGDSAVSTLRDPVHVYAASGRYNVRLGVSSDKGCLDFIDRSVYISPDFTFFIPNSFTPNKDLVNDVFSPGGIFTGLKEYSITIYNRWGEVVFETNDLKNSWNGNFQDGESTCATGIYVYVINTRDIFGHPHEYTGNIHLIR